jgi:hypothetical protein
VSLGSMELVSNPVGASVGAEEVLAITSSDVGPDPRKFWPAPVVPATPIASVAAMKRMQRHSSVARRGMERSRVRDSTREANPFFGLVVINIARLGQRRSPPLLGFRRGQNFRETGRGVGGARRKMPASWETVARDSSDRGSCAQRTKVQWRGDHMDRPWRRGAIGIRRIAVAGQRFTCPPLCLRSRMISFKSVEETASGYC